MAVRPIIFSGPMVNALLLGRKSQTRRVLKPRPVGVNRVGMQMPDGTLDCEGSRLPCRHGDFLWVREACRAEELSRPQETRLATKTERQRLGRTHVTVCYELDGADGVRYLADDEWRIIENSIPASDQWCKMYHYRGRGENGVGNTVPPIHMPRWASRLTIHVTAVKVERLQEISEADAEAEGCRWSDCHEGYTPCPAPADGRFYHGRWASRSFEMLWESLHGPHAWDRNPWVAAISFDVIRENVDRVLEREAA